MFTKRQFNLTEEEYLTIEKWAKEHDCTERTKNGPSKSSCGGEITIAFTPTSIGTAISVICVCGKKLDLDNL